MINFVYLWFAATALYLVIATEPRATACWSEGQECTFDAFCSDKTEDGICKSFDIEMVEDDCVNFTGSERYANHYVRIKLPDGFREGFRLSMKTFVYLEEQRINYMQLYKAHIDDDIPIVDTSLAFWIKKHNDKNDSRVYERYPDDSNSLVPKDWIGTPLNISDVQSYRYSISLENLGGTFTTRLGGISSNATCTDSEQLNKTLVLHLKHQIFPHQICFHGPPAASVEENTAKTKINATENVELGCTIFNRSAETQVVETKLDNGFTHRKKLSILASLKSAARFIIFNLVTSDQKVAFRMKLEPAIKRITLSHKLGKSWTEQAKYSRTPLNARQAFQLDLFRKNDTMLIFVNDSMLAKFDFQENAKFSNSSLEIHGDIIVDRVCYKDESPPQPIRFTAESLLKSECLNKWADVKQYQVPYTALPRELRPNESLTINMTPYMYKNTFALNLFDAKRKTVFHLSFRNDKMITIIKAGTHKKTERTMPLSIGRNCLIQITNKGNRFEIRLNKKHWKSSLNAAFRNPHYMHIYGNGLISGICLT